MRRTTARTKAAAQAPPTPRLALTALAAIVVVAWLVATGAASAGAPLHEAAVKGDLAEIDRLIAEGADVDFLKFGYASALSYAAEKGRLESVRHLVEVHGAKVDYGKELYNYPLFVAAQKGRREVAQYLVSQGADTTRSSFYKKKKEKFPYSPRNEQPNWPWDRWAEARRVELDRDRDLRDAADAERRAQAEAEAAAARADELRRRWERDARLPTDVRRDKYMLALRKKLDERDHESALVYIDFLRRLDVPLEPTFDLYHGEILLETGQADAALDRLYAFAQTIDSSDPNYLRALELINEAEGR